MRKIIHRLMVLLLVYSGMIGCSENKEPSKLPSPENILFMGNSFTSANGGLDLLVQSLLDSKYPDSRIFTATKTLDGATLQRLWEETDAEDIIHTGAYEVLLVQGDIPEGDIPTFNSYAKKFIGAAKSAGIRPVLLMGWAYERLDRVTQEEIAQAHYAVADATGVDIAPVGRAWSRVMAMRPDLDLYAADREHPSIMGSYLAACVIYATIMRESPEGASPPSAESAIPDEIATFLQQAAWDTVQMRN